MPFINPWSHRPSSPSLKKPDNDKYQVVEDILSAPDYYHVLGVSKDASTEDIRRAYIKKSRVCHPDKFVPPYPRATESFQLLSVAYETLSNPSSKLMYDLSKQHRRTATTEDDNPNETLQRVLHQLFVEMMEGEFQTMRAFIHALNEANPGMHISEEAISQIELAFSRMRSLLQSTHAYYKVIHEELQRLSELQYQLRQLSYFDIWRRMRFSISICKILLQLPIMINDESRKKQADEQGIFGTRVETALKLAVGLLEAGERYASW